MTISKANNQYYGKYFEQAIASIINKKDIVNNTDFEFSIEEIEKINKDAEMCAEYIGGSNAFYTGNETSKQSCDLIVDGQEIELKYTKNSNGTYFNTTVEYFTRNFSIPSFKQFLKEDGVLSYLEKFFGNSVYNDNVSPVSRKEGDNFRHNHPGEYKILTSIEKSSRKRYVNYLYNYFCNNEESLLKFARDMITKEESNKHIPDRLIIYTYDDCKIIEYSKKEIFTLSKDISFFSISGDFSLKFPNFKATIAWQNGTGLNNPTIRVFI